MSGFWNIIEQGKTGEVQYLRARLQISESNTTAQILTAVADTSAIFNISGYTQGYVSFESPGVATVSLHGSICTDTPAEFFEIKSETITSGGIDIIYTMPLKNIFIKVDSGTIAHRIY